MEDSDQVAAVDVAVVVAAVADAGTGRDRGFVGGVLATREAVGFLP